jgi:hypothetical protein
MRAFSIMTLAGLVLSACAGQIAGDDPSSEQPLSPLRAPWCRGNRCDHYCNPHHPRRGCVPPPVLIDAGTDDDAGSVPVTPDAGTPPVEHDAGTPPVEHDAGPPAEPDAGPPPTECVGARRLWYDDFETGDYSKWTSHTYFGDWGDGCESTAISTANPHNGSYSNRSEIVCRSYTDVHRGYGGIQFDHDRPLGAFTNTGTGIEAPGGAVSTFWLWLDTPYDFGGGRWLSLFTTNSACDYTDEVITVSLEDSTGRLNPAHITSSGGTVDFSRDAPAFPLRRWVRVTIYINYYDGVMHIWQDGVSVVHATFHRPTNDICQWHWGAYASGDNDDIVLFEDEKSIWKLDSSWTDWSTEPWFDEGGTVRACP